jgi:spore maturation protein CgeB
LNIEPNKPKLKFLLIADSTHFALTDVYYGYRYALDKLKIPFESFPWHHMRELIVDKQCYHTMHSTALIKEKGFTHILFIGGLNIPDFLFDNLYHIKSVVVSTEDPHSFDPMKHRLGKIDYYFTNERSIANSSKFHNVYYCPTAGSTHECGRVPTEYIEDKYKSDILFLGAMYPNRVKFLESIIPLVKRHKLDFKICGHTHYMPKNSPLQEFVFESGTIPHNETVKYYNGAKVVLNMFRDTKWNPRTKTKKNPYNRSRFTAESMNPRAYEVPLCQSFMLMEDLRPEAREVYTEDEVAFFSDEKSLQKQLRYYLVGKGKEKREKMAFNAYRKAAENHTYIHRLQSIKEILEEDI